MRYIPYIYIAVFLHAGLAFLLPEYANNITKEEDKKKYVRIKVVEKKERQVIEAPLKRTDAPEEADFIGKTDHKAQVQTKTKPNFSSSKKASAFEAKRYSKLLPGEAEEDYYRDFIPDENIAYAKAIDVNTYYYPLISYLTQVRSQVSLAFADPRSKLKQSKGK